MTETHNDEMLSYDQVKKILSDKESCGKSPIVCIPSKTNNHDEKIEALHELYNSLDTITALHKQYILDLKIKLIALTLDNQCKPSMEESELKEWEINIQRVILDIETYAEESSFLKVNFSDIPDAIKPPPSGGESPNSDNIIVKACKKFISLFG